MISKIIEILFLHTKFQFEIIFQVIFEEFYIRKYLKYNKKNELGIKRHLP